MAKNYRKRRQRLFEKDPFCFWCRCALVLIADSHTMKTKPPGNMATIDHLRSRLHPLRTEPSLRYEERTVLACLDCNDRRSREEVSNLTIQEQRDRAGAYPGIGFNHPRAASPTVGRA